MNALTIEAPVRHVAHPQPVLDDELQPTPPQRKWRPVAGCLGAYVALSLLLFYPIGPFDTRHLPIAGSGNPAGNDPFQMIWFLSYVPYALTHGLSLFHTNFIDYPQGVNLADNTSVPLLGILGWPITATLGPIATFNFLIRLSFAISGASMFLVLRRWCSSWQACFCGGLLYAFGPYTAAQALHLDLIFVPIPPLLVLFADEFVRRQRMSPYLLGLLVGVAATAQYLTSPDVLSGCVVMAVVVGVGLIVRFRRLIRERFSYMAKAAVIAVGSFAALAAYPLYEMMLGPGKIPGSVVQVPLLQAARADLLGALVPTSNQLLVPPFISHIGDYFVGGNLSENGTYLGIPLLVVLFFVVRRLKRDATVVVLASAGVAAWLLSLGGHLSIGTWASPVPLPGDLLTHLPLFDNTIPARYAIYVLLFASMLVAIGMDRLWLRALLPLTESVERAAPFSAWAARRFKLVLSSPVRATRAVVSRTAAPVVRLRTRAYRRRVFESRRTRLVVFAAIVVLSLLPNAPFASGGVPWPASLPSTVASVVKPGSVVLSIPFPTPASSQAMAWAAVDHMEFRIIGGYANIADPGEHYGQRAPLPLPPAHVQEMLSLPKLGSFLPWVPPHTAESQLLAYLSRYSVGAIVFSSMGLDTALAYAYLIDTLGQPEIVRPAFSIWLPTNGHWPSNPVG